MNLADVELQQTTGSLIARGSLGVGSERDTPGSGSATHSHVLLSSQTNALALWSVTHVMRDRDGFCETTLGEFGLVFRSINLNHVAQLPPSGPERHAVMRRGTQEGWLRRRVMLNGRWVERPAGLIYEYELDTRYGPEGMNISISGKVAIEETNRVEPFSADATIPWATLAVKGIEASSRHWKFGHRQGLPSKVDAIGRPRAPRKLSDLLISEGLAWPYLKGRISFTPEPSYPPPDMSTHDFVSIHFEEDHIGFWDARRLTVLDAGFARSWGITRHLSIAMFNRGKIERALQHRSSISIKLEGDLLGEISYQTGYGDEQGDPLGRIRQPIKSMSLHMALGTDGLEILADGELDDFDPLEFACHKAERNSKLKPLRTCSVRATMPWALLVSRDFSFAHRAQDF